MAKVITTGLGLELRGKAGSVVFAQTRYGLELRPHTHPRNPQTPAQMAARARLGQVSAAFKTLTPTQRDQWATYAAGVSGTRRTDKAPVSVTAQTAFIALGSKFLQVHPAGIVPLVPPTAPFFGDNITVSAAGSAGQIVFTATGANFANVVTELLLQPLAHGARSPKANLYRPCAFVPFASTSLSHAVTVPAGWVAPAYRFVNAQTGQEVEMVRLAAVQVS